ncbi:MAG: hypothetical protein ABSA16_15485 [Thermoguttaceae bacterium]|jgi:hypothetical protein
MAKWSINSVDTPEAQKAFREADSIETYDASKDCYEQLFGEDIVARMRPHGVGPYEIKQEIILERLTK